MKATNQQPERDESSSIEQATALSDAAVQPGGTHRSVSTVIESSADQPWAEFCSGLKRPAFLLPDSDSCDLEQP